MSTRKSSTKVISTSTPMSKNAALDFFAFLEGSMSLAERSAVIRGLYNRSARPALIPPLMKLKGAKVFIIMPATGLISTVLCKALKLVCMGHEPDLKAALEEQLKAFKRVSVPKGKTQLVELFIDK